MGGSGHRVRSLTALDPMHLCFTDHLIEQLEAELSAEENRHASGFHVTYRREERCYPYCAVPVDQVRAARKPDVH